MTTTSVVPARKEVCWNVKKKNNTMKKKTIPFILLAAVLLPQTLSAQTDPRTKYIIESILQSASGEIGSSASEAPKSPVKAKPLTTTEVQETQKQQKQRPQRTTSEADGKHENRPSADQGATATTAVPIPVAATKPSASRIDTIYLSTLYTTHVIFDTDISYADLSNQTDIAGKIVDEAKNKLALKARQPFTSTASVSVEESSGVFHTYILRYRERPKNLVIDTRPGADLDALSLLETVELSTLYTTHLIFSSDVIYADISQPGIIAGKLVDQGKNKLAIKAREAFSTTATLSVEEANGVFHTYLLRYEEHPQSLVKDTRNDNVAVKGSLAGETIKGTVTGSNVRNSASKSVMGTQVSTSTLKKIDAPTLSQVITYEQKLHHLSVKKYDIRLTCENIFSYSDIMYFTFRLDNGSGISYEVSDATFVIESSNGNKRKIVYEQNIFPKNRFGGLTTEPKGSSKICYSFDKIALSSDQVLKVYLYESGGQRNIVLSISYKDINRAVPPVE